MFRYPDSPKPISLDLLRRFDADPAGTWIASAKMDGRRRIATFDGRAWSYRAKNRDDAAPMPADLQEEFEDTMTPPSHWTHRTVTYDTEWCGLRTAGDAQSIWIFDILHAMGKDMWHVPYRERYLLLHELDIGLHGTDWDGRIHVVRHEWNPYLMEFFSEQLQDPLSEGIVVRKATSTIIGNPHRSVVNPECFKVKFDRVIERGKVRNERGNV